jgi:hypothetical protein
MNNATTTIVFFYYEHHPENGWNTNQNISWKRYIINVKAHLLVIYIFCLYLCWTTMCRVTDIWWFRQQPKNSLQIGYADICINGTPASM